MRPIIYDLRGQHETSDQFYTDLSLFVDRLLGNMDWEISAIVGEFFEFVADQTSESSRSREEHFFDLLMTGVLWNEYIHVANRLSFFEYKILHSLYKLRRKHCRIKPAVDKLRGILGTLWLQKRGTILPCFSRGSKDDLRSLIRWMEASGDFREESVRLSLVEQWLTSLSNQRSKSILEIIRKVATNFKSESLEYFRYYTGNINDYISENAQTKLWQENVIFCTRREVEYLMNMMGAEIMNRAMADSFEDTERKYALLPACMRQTPEACQAKKLSLEMVCSGCDSECNIYKFKEVGRQEGFAVRIMPHSSDFSRWLRSWAAGKDIGVIGVACPLHLIAGGLELRKLNIEAQCVFLDYCGCKNHWSEEGVMTDMNVNQLLKLIGSHRQDLAA